MNDDNNLNYLLNFERKLNRLSSELYEISLKKKELDSDIFVAERKLSICIKRKKQNETKQNVVKMLIGRNSGNKHFEIFMDCVREIAYIDSHIVELKARIKSKKHELDRLSNEHLRLLESFNAQQERFESICKSSQSWQHRQTEIKRCIELSKLPNSDKISDTIVVKLSNTGTAFVYYGQIDRDYEQNSEHRIVTKDRRQVFHSKNGLIKPIKSSWTIY